MSHDDLTHRTHAVAVAEMLGDRRGKRHCEAENRDEYFDPRYSYEMKLGRTTIRLRPIEFRILRFLSARPYHPFTRRQIANAISTRRQPVTPEGLDKHVSRLRRALGFFHDYIQRVPYIGYRFRA